MRRSIEPSGLGYSQAVLIDSPRRLLFVSGQVPADAAGSVPKDFDGQCRLAWRNVAAKLAAAGMRLEHLVKVTIFLADREYRAGNTKIRHEVLGEISPALTVIIADIFDADWLIEIEAIAAD